MRIIRRIVLLLAALSLFACDGIHIGSRKNPRDPVSMAEDVRSLYRLEIWSAHEQYEFGEPVHLRAAVTNLSKEEIRAELETDPIINIAVGDFAPRTEADAERVWSQEHPDEVRHALTLAPGESYVVEWTLVLSRRDRYFVAMCASADSSGFASWHYRGCDLGVDIYYGVELPEHPMP